MRAGLVVVGVNKETVQLHQVSALHMYVVVVQYIPRSELPADRVVVSIVRTSSNPVLLILYYIDFLDF